MHRASAVAGLALVLVSCGGAAPDRPDSPGAEEVEVAVSLLDSAQARSFLGDTLFPPEVSAQAREVALEKYVEAENVLDADPEDVDALIWMGRRTAYLGQFREAIDIYTFALELHPEDARLYRHRGHRYLTVREPRNAVQDFVRAAQLMQGTPDEIEPDGLPNERGIPTSTLQFNIWYHLGLAHYLMGDLEAAVEAYRSCLIVSAHADSVVATSYWLYMALSRLGRDAEATAVLESIHEDMEIIEGSGYLNLLLLFKGERTLEDLLGPSGSEATLQSTTIAYGLGVWHLLQGRDTEAIATFERILTARSQWGAFGYMAAEAELARSMGRPVG